MQSLANTLAQEVTEQQSMMVQVKIKTEARLPGFESAFHHSTAM